MLSTWDKNMYRTNEYIDMVWKNCYKVNQEHFYHVGAKESNRNSMLEALLMNYNPAKIPAKEGLVDDFLKLLFFDKAVNG